jgi:hypothetical protein
LGDALARQGKAADAAVAFKQSSSLGGEYQFQGAEGGSWDYVGPFIIGKAELDGDPLEAYGGIRKIIRADKSAKFFSELVPGGEVRWSKLRVQVNALINR